VATGVFPLQIGSPAERESLVPGSRSVVAEADRVEAHRFRDSGGAVLVTAAVVSTLPTTTSRNQCRQ
jgi:hypothetical protein